MTTDSYFADNEANWDDRANVHVGSSTYDVDRFAATPDAISGSIRFDAPLIGDIAGKRVVHLQCHIGVDTISLARLGATVTGVDFSAVAIGHANELSARVDTPASFVRANVYDAATAVGEVFDLVYTSVGTITWLDDLDKWAAAVAALLVDGGRFYIRDCHPALWPFEEVEGAIVPTYDYFMSDGKPLSWDENDTYTDGDHSTITNTRHHEWNHSLAEIVNSLIGAGLVIDRMEDHKGIEWAFVPSCVQEGDQWFLPEPWRSAVPAMFSLWAHKPE